MKLSFECNFDPRELVTKQGKKFCQNCQKHVFDLRRKSDEKIALFYKENPTACVIAYEDQLDKLPAIQPKYRRYNYVPYATAVLAVALLPSLTIAQTQTRIENQTYTTMPVVVPNMAAPATEITKEVSTKTTEGLFYIKGKVKLTHKRNKTKKGREIVIYKNSYSIDGISRRDTLAIGKLSLNGKFRFKIKADDFVFLQNSYGDIEIDIEGFSRERFKDLTFDKNVARGIVYASARKRFMGRVMGKF